MKLTAGQQTGDQRWSPPPPDRWRPDSAAAAVGGAAHFTATLPTQQYATFQAPVLAYSVDEDPQASRESVDAMMAAHPDVERRHLAPADIGLD